MRLASYMFSDKRNYLNFAQILPKQQKNYVTLSCIFLSFCTSLKRAIEIAIISVGTISTIYGCEAYPANSKTSLDKQTKSYILPMIVNVELPFMES